MSEFVEAIISYIHHAADDQPVFPFPVTINSRPTIIVVSTLLAVSWVMLTLRLWTRSQLVKVFGWDDAFMVITVSCFTIFAAGALKISTLLDGRDNLTKGQIILSTDVLIMTESFYIWTMVFLKISLAVFFLRIMVKTVQRRIVQLTVCLSTTMGVIYFFLIVFQCGTPVRGMTIIERMLRKQCLSTPTVLGVAYTHASITLLTDIILAVIPAFMLQGAQMSGREKWVVYFILSLGTVGAVASALRIQYLGTLVHLDPSFFAAARSLTIWSTIEPALGIIAACLATLRKLFGWTGRQISGLRSTFKEKMTPTHTLTSQNKSDPLTSPVDDENYPDLDQTSDVQLVSQAEYRDAEKTQRWRHDVEMAALPSSTHGSNFRINEAYG